jgi:two-component system, LytTR family, sensor kinase
MNCFNWIHLGTECLSFNNRTEIADYFDGLAVGHLWNADFRVPAMDTIFKEVCVLVTTAFVLTLAPGLRRRENSLLTLRDRGTALIVFLALGLVEEASVMHSGWLNHRIVAACAAGLLAGPSVGLIVGGFVTVLAVLNDGLPPATIGISMLCGGLIGGCLYRWKPAMAQKPLTGFILTLAVSWTRDGLILSFAPHSHAAVQAIGDTGLTPLVQGLGTALILAIVAQVRERDSQARAAAASEVRALQARMNPHFLFNALNAIAALATSAPREVPRAAGRLRQFLRASFDQADRALITLEEELAVVDAYLDIETLRFGSRLRVEQAIDPGSVDVLVPPFSLQPLVENAVQHGLQSSPKAGHLGIIVRRVAHQLEMSVSDDGRGVAPADIEKVFFAQRPRAHALVVLRRRLKGLFGRSFQLDVWSATGEGTSVTLQIPFRTRLEPARGSAEAVKSDGSRLVTH